MSGWFWAGFESMLVLPPCFDSWIDLRSKASYKLPVLRVDYPYFICLGRHQKRTTCTRKALLVAKIEKLIEDYWATVRLDPALRDAVEAGLRAELASHRSEAEQERKHLSGERAALMARREKLVEAIYTGAIPMDLIAGEQQRISEQLASIEQRLAGAAAEFDRIEANLTAALDLARDCHAAYRAAGPFLRRLFNQAFFTHLYIDDGGVRGTLAEPFDVLLGSEVLQQGRARLSLASELADGLNEGKEGGIPTRRPPGR